MTIEDLRQIAERATDDCDCDPIIQHSDTCLYWTGQVYFDNTFSPEFILLMLDALEAAMKADVSMDTAMLSGVQNILAPAHQDSWAHNHTELRHSLETLTKHLEGK